MSTKKTVRIPRIGQMARLTKKGTAEAVPFPFTFSFVQYCGLNFEAQRELQHASAVVQVSGLFHGSNDYA